jgi:HEPN domain-containing protein
MSDRPDKHVRTWLTYAREDLAAADELLESPNVVKRVACFHAQQAAEKAIKAALIFAERKPPRQHDLKKLCDALPEGWLVKAIAEEADRLSPWAAESRYPGPWPTASDDEAKEAVGIANKVVRLVEQDLKSRGLG